MVHRRREKMIGEVSWRRLHKGEAIPLKMREAREILVCYEAAIGLITAAAHWDVTYGHWRTSGTYLGDEHIVAFAPMPNPPCPE
jgi:hypothetical protein